jgi:hypothetical protein
VNRVTGSPRLIRIVATKNKVDKVSADREGPLGPTKSKVNSAVPFKFVCFINHFTF